MDAAIITIENPEDIHHLDLVQLTASLVRQGWTYNDRESESDGCLVFWNRGVDLEDTLTEFRDIIKDDQEWSLIWDS